MNATAAQATIEHPVPEGVNEALALIEKNPAELAADLRAVGMLTIVGLNPEAFDPDVSYDRWESVGVLFGVLYAGSKFALGDWINWGERVFGQEAAQAVESTPSERYSQAQRVTGLAPGTLANIASVCGRVAFDRRRPGVSFETHAEVAALDPDQQVFWLDKVVENGWSRDDLRRELRPRAVPPETEPGGDGRVSPAEQLQDAARLVFHQGQRTSDGQYLVPGEAWGRLAAALGEE
jgi:hypothetical protein